MDIGFDGGFFATKAVAGASKDEEVTFPSFAVPPVESLMSLNGHETVIIQSERTGTLLVGREAVKKTLAGARDEAASWIQGKPYLAMFYRALSDLTAAKGATVNLVTGLPLADFQRDKDTLRMILEGSHTFNQQGRYRQTLTVESVRVVPQAWGAVLYSLFDDKGRVADGDLLHERVAVIDVGGRTVNYLGVDGLSDIPAQSRGTDRGAWNVMRRVRKFFEANYPDQNKLQDHQVMGMILDGEFYDAGERVDLTPITGPILDEIGDEIVSTATQYWGARAATHRRVFVIGGGAHLWGDRIREAFRQAVVFDEPEMVNARGFYRFASYIAHQLLVGNSEVRDG